MGLTRFEWDRVKDAANRAKHGVSFKVAQYAFVDPQRVIAEDASHSRSEKRYYCFGRVGEGVITVVLRIAATLYESLAPVTGARGKTSMKQKINYTDEPLGILRAVKDFLPSPDQLALSEDTVKITIALSKSSVTFFKQAATKHGSQYQRMIRNLLDYYTVHHQRP